MSDPKRLSLEYQSDFEQMLLRAGRTEAPAGARQRALVAVSASLALSSVAAGGAAAGQTAAAAKAGLVATLQWLSVVGAIAVGTVAAVVGVRAAHRDDGGTRTTVNAAPASLDESAPTAADVARVTATPATPQAPVVEAVRAPAATARFVARSRAQERDDRRSVPRTQESSVSSASSALPVELVMLDNARSATTAGDTTHALSILDAYAARFPRGAMAPEAAVLRVEALVKAGDRPGATRFAHAFLAGAPHSPYAARIQSLLSASNP